MKKLFIGFAVVASLMLGTVAFMGTPAQAETTCVHNLLYFKADASRIGGPDLTASLEAGLLAETGKSTLASVLSSKSWSIETLAAKAVIVAASNGAPGETGFSGSLGKAFYTATGFFEGTKDASKFELALATLVLELYNNGVYGVPRCR